jgi:glycosyltransferase involved in cell wall biosynthesis
VVIQWITAFHALPIRRVLAGADRAVAIVHNAIPHERIPFSVRLTRAALKRVDAAVTHSRTVADDLAGILTVPHIATVPHPPNLEIEPMALPDTRPPGLLFLGFVRPYKGVDIAIEAVGLLRDRGRPVRLTVAGEFWDPVERYAELVRHNHLGDLVDLRPGYSPDDEVRSLLASHHLIVTPYRTATQSGIVPLAFAAGRPVVSTDTGGLGEQVVEGVSGSLAPPDDPVGFAEAVERALDAIERLAEGALASRTSWEDVARTVVELGAT